MGERYSMLPSEVLARSSTIDLYVMDAALSYHDYQNKKSQGKFAGQETPEELAEMLKKAREQHG